MSVERVCDSKSTNTRDTRRIKREREREREGGTERGIKDIMRQPQRQRIIEADRIEQKAQVARQEKYSIHQSGKLMRAGLKDI